MSENRRILGARRVEYEGIKFQSLLEFSCFKRLEISGLSFRYEPERIVLWEGIKCQNINFYAPKKIHQGKYGKDLELQTRALLNMSYTPDFLVEKENYRIYFDVKGKENDVYPLKKKMFLKVLELKDDGFIYMFFEPHNVKQMNQAIKIIQEL